MALFLRDDLLEGFPGAGGFVVQDSREPAGFCGPRQHIVHGDAEATELPARVLAQLATAPRMVFETPRLGIGCFDRGRNDVDDAAIPGDAHARENGLCEMLITQQMLPKGGHELRGIGQVSRAGRRTTRVIRRGCVSTPPGPHRR